MRVLVTGASGFVGSHLVPHLEASGHAVTATDQDVDVTNPLAVTEKLREVRPEGLVHLAALSSVAASWKNPAGAWALNYVGSACVISAVRTEAPAARVLLVGSSDAYANDPASGARPLREDAPLDPESPYARSKAAAEQLGVRAAAEGLGIVRVRAFTHIGRGQADTFVAASFARQIAEIEAGRREPLLRVGNLDSVRDVLDVRDVVRAYELLLDPAVPVDTYNVASGRGVAVREMLDTLLELSGVEAKVEVDPERFRPTDYKVGDASRLRAATGWEPRIPLRETLTGVLAGWRERVAASSP